MEYHIKFNKSNTLKRIPINPENLFFKITRIEIPSIPKGSNNIAGLAPDFVLSIKTYGENNKSVSSNQISGVIPYLNPNQREAKFIIDEIVEFPEGHEVLELIFENKSEEDEEVLIYYTHFEEKVELLNPFETFNKDFRIRDNTRILFSAPFGQGKTTFLNEYFENNKEEFEVFKLFPVNYAVSHNEDIFKYIKVELLFQLLGKDVDFEKEKFTYLETAPAFFKKNAYKIIAPLLTLLPKVGKSAADIYNKLFKLAEEYLDYHKAIQIDEKDKALAFINELYEKEGSIFEDNFYTQLIRQLLEQHKQKHNRKNVLVIDDIDRMDPDHIFRIFNVLSANFDSNDFINGYANKFGFDKIILVCDYGNIKEMFIHRYGSNVAFDGYLSKYYSRHPFFYNNTKAMEAITRQLVFSNGKEVYSVVGEALLLIINDLISTNQITLRDLLKLLKFNFYKTIDIQVDQFSENLKSYHANILYFNIIAFLKNVFELDSIIEKFKRCSVKAQQRDRKDYTYFTQVGLVAFVRGTILPNSAYKINFNNEDYTFKISHKSEQTLNFAYYEAQQFASGLNTQNISFNVRDFYQMLIQNAEIYSKLY